MLHHLPTPEMTPQLHEALALVKKLLDAGFETYLAGGWVRDCWLHRATQDIDIATAAPMEKVQQLLPKTIPVGASFGCLIAPMGKWHFEVTTFRRDGAYLDGRHPIAIEVGSAEEDALRRDFTVNGLFYDTQDQCVLDFVGGIEDLKAKRLRCIGDPLLRFKEDKLRLLRCARFATQLGFDIESATLSAVKELAFQLRTSVSKERIWQELSKLLEGSKCARGATLLYQLNLAKSLTPPLPILKTPAETIDRLSQLPPKTALIYQLLTLWMAPREPERLLGDSGEIQKAFQHLFPLSRRDKKRMELWLAMQRLWSLKSPSNPRFQWCALYSDPLAEECMSAFLPLLSPAQRVDCSLLHQQLAPHIARARGRKPLLSASFLQQRGIAPGPELGQLLRCGEMFAIELDLKTPQQVLDHLLEST